MPVDKYSFRAVDSIRSFAGQMLHLASGNVFLIGAATGAKIDWPGRGLERGQTTIYIRLQGIRPPNERLF